MGIISENIWTNCVHAVEELCTCFFSPLNYLLVNVITIHFADLMVLK